ncbi:hypothetical protein CVT24_005534 [Panaeolus cyanescens]|uniref:Uncharacterized protein n=1 Tax=Panaeolus cyanescens TaxID=181874 RepID=A0A409VQJ3_9AGAR|nr:hypothetical protein CVT24_005534 [Panaeolus cyanescens]
MTSKVNTDTASKKAFSEKKAFFQNYAQNQSAPVKSSSKYALQPTSKRKSLTLTERWAKFNKASEAEESVSISSRPKPRISTSYTKPVVKRESSPETSSLPHTSSPEPNSMVISASSATTPPELSEEAEMPTKICMTRNCFAKLSIYQSFKRCHACRAKERLKSQLKRERAKLRMMQDIVARNFKEEDDDAEMDDVEALALSGERGVKRKAPPKLLNELEGEDLKKAIKIMKTGVARLVTDLATKVPQQTVNSNLTEYQNATDLYDSIRVAMGSANRGSFAFIGHHTIVPVPSINNATRAEYVSKDLRKIVKLPFNYHLPISSATHPQRSNEHVMRFKCNCLNVKKVLGTASQQAIQPEVACGGRIKVTVSDETSHPRFMGQKIEVRVRHDK